MENIRKVFAGVNPYEYEQFKQFLVADEHVQVLTNHVDSFSVIVTELRGHYNRNGNILVLTLHRTEWSDDAVDDLIGKLASIVGKEEAGENVQAFPLMTPIDHKTGLPLKTEPEQKYSEYEEGQPPENLPEQVESPKTGEVVSGETADPKSEETQPPAEGNVVGVIPVVKPLKKGESYDPNAQQSSEVQ